MRHLIRESLAVYYQIQPGDGTRYTAFYVSRPDNDPDNIYVAVGSGQYIQGGYLMRRSSLRNLAERLYKPARDQERLDQWLKEDHYINYWNPHFKVYAEYSEVNWTTMMAVLFGLAMTMSPDEEDIELTLKFIGDVYHDRYTEVAVTLLEWLATEQ